MDINLKVIVNVCLFPIIALIFLEIIWNLAGYQVEPLMWVAKLALLGWAGFRYISSVRNGGS